MKEYNRKIKLWEEVSTEKVGNLKKVDKCKGFPAHDYRLCLPSYMAHRGIHDSSEEVIQQWYESEDRIKDVELREHEFQKSLGLAFNNYLHHPITRHYECCQCGKLHYN